MINQNVSYFFAKLKDRFKFITGYNLGIVSLKKIFILEMNNRATKKFNITQNIIKNETYKIKHFFIRENVLEDT